MGQISSFTKRAIGAIMPPFFPKNYWGPPKFLGSTIGELLAPKLLIKPTLGVNGWGNPSQFSLWREDGPLSLGRCVSPIFCSKPLGLGEFGPPGPGWVTFVVPFPKGATHRPQIVTLFPSPTRWPFLVWKVPRL